MTSDAYIVIKGKITVVGKNSASFRSCISKIKSALIKSTLIDNAEDLDIVMPMHNLLESGDNCSMASESLWNYYRGEVNDDANENSDAGNYRINNNKTTTS